MPTTVEERANQAKAFIVEVHAYWRGSPDSGRPPMSAHFLNIDGKRTAEEARAEAAAVFENAPGIRMVEVKSCKLRTGRPTAGGFRATPANVGDGIFPHGPSSIRRPGESAMEESTKVEPKPRNIRIKEAVGDRNKYLVTFKNAGDQSGRKFFVTVFANNKREAAHIARQNQDHSRISILGIREK